MTTFIESVSAHEILDSRGNPAVKVEDSLAQDDWESWKLLTKEKGEKIQIVGDD